jgi:plastocyanin
MRASRLLGSGLRAILALVLAAGPPAASAVEHVVQVADYTFTPKTVTLAPGDTVRWTSAGGGHAHNVVADDGSFRCAIGCDGSGGSGAPDDGAWSASVAFAEPGEFPYFCEVHGGPGGVAMSGTVTVLDPGPCVVDATTLCLGDGRFRVRAHWQTGDGQSGAGHGVTLTGDTGYFWFFNDANVEAVVKVLDGCGLNQRHWVFAGGLTNVRVVLTVSDTSTGIPKTYVNPQGSQFQPIQDTGAFATCP